jgi:hypothetical protein
MTAKSSKYLCGVIHVILVAYLVDVVQDEREVEEECEPLTREEKEDC